MVNTSVDTLDTRVDNQPIALPEQGEEMREYTPRPQPLAPAPHPHTPEPRPRARTLETHLLIGLEVLGIVTPQKPRLAVPSVRETEAAANTANVDVDQQLLGESAGGDSLPYLPLPEV